MKKNTLIRNNAPHAVNMPEGSHVAARKAKKLPAEPAPPEPPVSTTARKTPSKKGTETPPSKAAPSMTAKTRSKPKTRPKAPPQIQVAPELTLPDPAATAPIPLPAPAPLDEAQLWEKDSPVQCRMAQIKARNALLEEQLQRLLPPFQARGPRP